LANQEETSHGFFVQRFLRSKVLSEKTFYWQQIQQQQKNQNLNFIKIFEIAIITDC
jgi:hypothetical protein